MAGNQTQIPVIQHQDSAVTLIQQNTNKVLRNLNNQITDNTTFADQSKIIGEIKIANLTESQFQAIAGTDWLLNNGQSCLDTEYSRRTQNNVVPTLTVGGINTFIRVN